MRIQDRDVVVEGRFIKTVRLEHEWYEDLKDPESFVDAVRKSGVKADLVSFWQRFPETTPQFKYFSESEDLAVLPVRSYDDWWNNRIKSRTRGMLRKTEKLGTVVRETQFDDDFIRGMVEIFNETPVRQGMPFWHYGKDFDTVKQQFSKFIFREDIIGAYYQDKLIGFVMMANAGEYTLLGQILSMVEHRDKTPNNALIAKAVEVTARKQIPYLIYNSWKETALTEFKRRNGFEKQSVPRYYVPLTALGSLCIRFGAHRELAHMFPKKLVFKLKEWRAAFYARRHGSHTEKAVAQTD